MIIHKLKPVAFGLAIGITWGLGLALVAFINTFTNWGRPFVELVGSVYMGYEVSLYGAFIGFCFGLVDGFIGGLIVACIYNFCAKCNFK